MGARRGPRAVLLDALGTLVRLEPPAPHLRRALATCLDLDVGADVAEAAIRAEIAFYRANMDTARDASSLAALRRRCAEVVRARLPGPAAEAPLERVEAALLESLRFIPFPDVIGTLGRLRAAGVRLVVVSNWDVSLHEVLERTGVDVLLDGALASAEVGAAKPDPAIVRMALEIAGAAAQDAWLVGDTPEADIAAAVAAGVRPVLLDRDGGRPPAADVEVTVIRSLRELPALVAAP